MSEFNPFDTENADQKPETEQNQNAESAENAGENFPPVNDFQNTDEPKTENQQENTVGDEQTPKVDMHEAYNGNPNAYPYGANQGQGNGYQGSPYQGNNGFGGQPANNGYPYGANPGAQGQGYGNGYPYGGNPGNPNNSGYYGNPGQAPRFNAQQSFAPDSRYAYNRNGNPQGHNKKSKKGRGIFIGILIVVLVGVIAGLSIGLINSGKNGTYELLSSQNEETHSENVDEFTSQATPKNEDTTVATGALTSSQVYNKVYKASVGILVYDSSKQLSSEGTGVLFSEDNDGKNTYVVTCAHVIKGAKTVMVQMYDEKEYPATIIGYDSKTDIGVLKINEAGFELASFGDSSKIAVGDVIYAIGNPGGTEFANSFTNGMVSAIDRPVSSSSTGYTMECIQHTAAINPGNSGGALVNEYGQVIGINSMKIVADEYEGMGFAVPSSVFIDIVNEIVKNGYVSNRPKLGITYIAATNQQTYAIFVAANKLPAGSIIVYSISEDSSLYGTDAQKGDLIIAVNGKNLDESGYLPELIENSKVGDELTLTMVRINSDYSSKQFTVKVKLVEDRTDSEEEEEETTTSMYDYFFGNGSGSQGSGSQGGGYSGGNGDSDDYYDDYYNDFYDYFFGGGSSGR